MSNTANRVIKNTGFLYMRMAISMFILLYSTRLVLNSLGASDYGIFNIIGGAIAMLGFFNASLASSTQRYMNYCEGEGDVTKQKKIFNVSFVLHFFTAIIIIIIFIIAGYVFFNGVLNIPINRINSAKIIYCSLIISTITTILGVPYDAAMNAHENMKFYAIVGIIESILKLIVAAIIVFIPQDKLIIYGILMSLIPINTYILMYIYCKKHYKECVIAPIKYWDYKLFKQMTNFAGWNFIGTATSMIGQYGLGIILNHFYGALLNAAQGIATQTSGQLMAFSRNMLKALNPVIAKNEGAGNREAMLNASATGCKFSFFILAFFSIPTIIEMPLILKIWLSNVPEWSIIFTRIMLIENLIQQTTIVFSTSLEAEGHISKLNQCISIVNISPLIIVYFLFKFGYSPLYMYIINLFAYGIIYSSVVIVFMKVNCQMTYSYFWRKVLKPTLFVTIITSIMASLPTIYMDDGWMRIVAVLVLSVLFFCISLWLLGINKFEKIFLKQFFIRIIKSR